MKRTATLILITLLVLLAFSCGKNEKDKLPDEANKVTTYATIPSFKVMFLAMNSELDIQTTSSDLRLLEPSVNDPTSRAYTWGALTADAVIALRNSDAVMLDKILAQLITIAPQIGLADISDELRNKVRPAIAEGDWEYLETSIFSMQSEAEKILLANKQYEVYTMLTLGEWTEASYHIAGMIHMNYTTDRSKVLQQFTAWQNISNNLELAGSAKFKDNKKVLGSKDKVLSILHMMVEVPDNPLPPESVSLIRDLAAEIRGEYVKIKP